MSCVGKKKALRKGMSKQRSAKVQKICAESDDASWTLRPALIANSGTATTVQNQLSMSVNIHPSSSAVIMPSQISTLPSQATQMSTLPSQATGIMPSQMSTLPLQATASQMSSVFPAPSNPFYTYLFAWECKYVLVATRDFQESLMVSMLIPHMTWLYDIWNQECITAQSLGCRPAK